MIVEKKSFLSVLSLEDQKEWMFVVFERLPFTFDYLVFDEIQLSREDIGYLCTLKCFPYRKPYSPRSTIIQIPDTIICVQTDTPFKLNRKRENVFIINLNKLK